MICGYPHCGCKIDVPHGQLFPKQGQCPLCEDARANLGLDILKEDLLELMNRAPRVWGDKRRVTILADQFDCMCRLVLLAQATLRNKRHNANS